MGKYQDIATLIEQSVPDYTSLKIVPRGTPVFQDLLMTGQVRYARRTGANFAVLNPDNQFTLTAPGQVEQQTLTVSKILQWLEVGALITFNNTEMMEVESWEPTTKTVFINEPLSASRNTGEVINLWATPLKVHFNSNADDTQIFVRSRYQLVNGDAITLPISGTLNSLKQIDVMLATAAGIDVDPEFPFIYVLELAEPMPIDLTAATPLYLRAFPSYVSNVLGIPKLRNSQLGPFLLDFVASPLDSISSYPETFAVRTIASGNAMVDGGANYFKTVDHNYPIVNRPIYAENMIFWHMVRGYGGFILPNKFRMVTTDLLDGEFVARVQTRLVPPIAPGIQYNFKVQATADGVMVVIPHPYPPIVVNVPVQTPTTINVQTPVGGAPIDRLDFIFRATRQDAEVTIADATLPNDPVVQNFQYSYVFRVLGSTNFQATSVIVKPYFLTLSDLTARYNDEKTYNSGFIYL